MRAAITRYLEALKRRRAGDEGFSLIELIVVVAILGILVAIAIPVFGNIQATARQNALDTAAASGATAAAAAIADSEPATPAALLALVAVSNTDDYTYSVTAPAAAVVPDLTNFCVVATAAATGSLNGATAAESGPGC